MKNEERERHIVSVGSRIRALIELCNGRGSLIEFSVR